MIRVWWIPQLGMNSEPFRASVETIAEGKRLYHTLAQYDLYQYKNKVKPDYSNIGGLEIFDEETKEWEEWQNEDGYTISEIDPNENKMVEKKSNQVLFFERYGLKAAKDIVEKCPEPMTIYDMSDKRYYTAKWYMPETAFYISDMKRLIESMENIE